MRADSPISPTVTWGHSGVVDDQPTPTEALDAPVPPARRLRPWMIVSGAALVVVVITGVVLALVLPRATTGPASIATPSSTPQATAVPTSSATATTSPTASPTEEAPVAQPESGDQPAEAPPAAAPPADPAPVLPPPPAPIITPTITTFTATNFNNSSQTIAQGCAASSDGTLAVRITWATQNTTPTIAFRTQISGSPPIDSTITGYAASGENHYLQLRCAKIAYVTMTFHSENLERQARLTIDGNGPAGWSYLN